MLWRIEEHVTFSNAKGVVVCGVEDMPMYIKENDLRVKLS